MQYDDAMETPESEKKVKRFKLDKSSLNQIRLPYKSTEVQCFLSQVRLKTAQPGVSDLFCSTRYRLAVDYFIFSDKIR